MKLKNIFDSIGLAANLPDEGDLQVRSPIDGALLARLEAHSAADVDAAIAASSAHASTPNAASQTNTPSHPASSASSASATCSGALPPGSTNP